jgi:hypothetical protein
MIYSGTPKECWASSGVAILIKKEWKYKIIDCLCISDRIIQVRIKIINKVFTIIGIYAPVEGSTQTNDFYNELQEILNKRGKIEHIIMAGDFNARIGNRTNPGCIGSEGEPTLNNNGSTFRDFCTFNNFKVTNTFFRHKNINKYTWEARGSKSVIDYVVIVKKPKNNIDTRVYKGCEIDSDNFLLESKFKFPIKKYKTHNSKTLY